MSTHKQQYTTNRCIPTCLSAPRSRSRPRCSHLRSCRLSTMHESGAKQRAPWQRAEIVFSVIDPSQVDDLPPTASAAQFKNMGRTLFLIPAHATYLNLSMGVHPRDSASQALDKVGARLHFDRSGQKQAVLYEIPYVLNCIEIWRELRVLRQSLESSGFLCFDISPLTQELFKILHDG